MNAVFFCGLVELYGRGLFRCHCWFLSRPFAFLLASGWAISLDLGVQIAEGVIPFRQRFQVLDLDANLLQVRHEFRPFWPLSNVDGAGPMGEFDQRTPHGLGEQSGEVVDGRRFLDGPVSQHEIIGVADD
jgi:hypothetical protein